MKNIIAQLRSAALVTCMALPAAGCGSLTVIDSPDAPKSGLILGSSLLAPIVYRTQLNDKETNTESVADAPDSTTPDTPQNPGRSKQAALTPKP